MFFSKKKAEKKKEVPKELPPLAINMIKRRAPVQPAPVSAAVPKELPKVSEPVATPSVVKEDSNEKKDLDFERIGYFMDLLKGISNRPKEVEEAEKMYNESILGKDLLGEMKAFWKEKKKDIIFTSEERKLKEKLLGKIEALKRLETEWQDFHLGLIEREEGIRKNEGDLKAMLEQFKSICQRHVSVKKKMDRIKTGCSEIPEDKYFRLCNGEAIKDVPSLVESLRCMDNHVFASHVNGEKNDFAAWMRGVFEDEEVASRLESVSTSEEMADVLEKEYL